MNIKKELEYMNFDDLKSICKEINVSYSYSKENTIEKLVKPIEKNYKMNNHKKSTELNINEYKKLNRNKSPIDTIIIGASVAGLSIANKLDNSIILESRMKESQLKTFKKSYNEKIKFGKLVYSKNLKNYPS